MECNKLFSVHLKRAIDKGDRDGLLSSLSRLKKYLRGSKNCHNVDRDTFQILINLIKYPNADIMNASMSILANCCLANSHREMFRDLGGIPHVVLIIKTIDNDSLVCRASRLLGNLAINYHLATVLNEYDVGRILVKSLENSNDKSPSTIMMMLRAIKKLWAVKEYQSKMLPEDVTANLSSCLHSTNDQVVMLSVETLTLFSTVNNSQSKIAFKVSKDLLAKLVELSKNEEMNRSVVKCLSSLVCHHASQVWEHLEGSKLPEVFINYMQRADAIGKDVLEAFYKLCTEAAVRSKVKASGLLPRLIKLCCGSCVNRILAIFYLFQYDIPSINMLAQEKEFVSLLARNVPNDGAVRLLSVVARLVPPVKELLVDENFNSILKHKECRGILREIARTKVFVTHLIAAGRIWELAEANCLSVDQGQYEELIVHLLHTGDRSEVENAALAAPFLVKPRHFPLYSILVHNDAFTIILRLLKERTLEERILASIVKLISIFKGNSYNYKDSSGFFFGDSSSGTRADEASRRNEMPEEVTAEEMDYAERVRGDGGGGIAQEMITFELDCGSLVTVDKHLMCRVSPVLDAMLNGHFIESNQETVRMSCCSREALLNLEKLLLNEVTATEMNIETHLELISLTDRFLMSNLNDLLTASLTIDQSSCVAVLEWCRKSGFTKNNGIIKDKAFGFVFSSSAHLLLAMKCESLRSPLVAEISNYLSNAFMELL